MKEFNCQDESIAFAKKIYDYSKGDSNEYFNITVIEMEVLMVMLLSPLSDVDVKLRFLDLLHKHITDVVKKTHIDVEKYKTISRISKEFQGAENE